MDAPQKKQSIPGYDYGTDRVAKSPITMQEWEELKKSALFSEEDVFYLRLSEDVLADQVEDLLKTWRGIIFDHPHLRAYDEAIPAPRCRRRSRHEEPYHDALPAAVGKRDGGAAFRQLVRSN